jgi:light-regulated signal transduction histidine kinase (bacteriophytochrome)
MSSANSKPARYQADDLETALQAETKLRLELEETLRRTREEFQDFMHSAVHDLREPLRTVNAYCELLARKSGASDPEAEQFRRYIGEGTSKVQAVLAGMVEYADAGSNSRYVIRVELNEVFREAAASLPTPLRDRPAFITRDALPTVKGDFEKLVKVFRHLLENAVRYADAPELRIHTSARREDSEWVLEVQDNGPGIDGAYHQRIFEPFKRLHGRHTPGLGLGLAYCQRAVGSMGGRIWVESCGRGSTFCFTLPAAD